MGILSGIYFSKDLLFGSPRPRTDCVVAICSKTRKMSILIENITYAISTITASSTSRKFKPT
jgi:hypothetical protein